MKKRCRFCARQLNADGYCENSACPDNLRRKLAASQNKKSREPSNNNDSRE